MLYAVVVVCPFDVDVAGIDSVAATVVLCGVNPTARSHVTPGCSVAQFELTLKLGSETLGAPIVRAEVPVFERAMVCCVAVDPGTFEKVSAIGLIASPGSGEP